MGSDFLNRVLFILVYGNPSSLLNIPCADADTEKRMLWTLKKTMETSMLLILVAPHIYTFLHCSYFIFFRKTGTLTVNVKPSEMFFFNTNFCGTASSHIRRHTVQSFFVFTSALLDDIVSHTKKCGRSSSRTKSKKVCETRLSRFATKR